MRRHGDPYYGRATPAEAPGGARRGGRRAVVTWAQAPLGRTGAWSKKDRRSAPREVSAAHAECRTAVASSSSHMPNPADRPPTLLEQVLSYIYPERCLDWQQTSRDGMWHYREPLDAFQGALHDRFRWRRGLTATSDPAPLTREQRWRSEGTRPPLAHREADSTGQKWLRNQLNPKPRSQSKP